MSFTTASRNHYSFDFCDDADELLMSLASETEDYYGETATEDQPGLDFAAGPGLTTLLTTNHNTAAGTTTTTTNDTTVPPLLCGEGGFELDDESLLQNILNIDDKDLDLFGLSFDQAENEPPKTPPTKPLVSVHASVVNNITPPSTPALRAEQDEETFCPPFSALPPPPFTAKDNSAATDMAAVTTDHECQHPDNHDDDDHDDHDDEDFECDTDDETSSNSNSNANSNKKRKAPTSSTATTTQTTTTTTKSPKKRKSSVASAPTTTTTTLVSSVELADVVLGRGGQSIHHVGNVQFRHLVTQHLEDYQMASKTKKTAIATSVVHEITNVRGGRFLTKARDSQWQVVSFEKARTKTSQRFREALGHQLTMTTMKN